MIIATRIVSTFVEIDQTKFKTKLTSNTSSANHAAKETKLQVKPAPDRRRESPDWIGIIASSLAQIFSARS